MDDRPRPEDAGEFELEFPLDDDNELPPDEFGNPPGVSRGDCDDEAVSGEDASCDLEITAQVQDLLLEESKPGSGIAGYEGEEDGGG